MITLHFMGLLAKGHTRIADVLLSEFGADVEVCNKQNDTVLNIAALNWQSNVVNPSLDVILTLKDTTTDLFSIKCAGVAIWS